MPEKMKRQIVYKFEDEERMDMINQWIFEHRTEDFEDILDVKVPGKYSSGAVFITVLILLAFHWFQNR